MLEDTTAALQLHEETTKLGNCRLINIAKSEVDLRLWALSMGKLHHAMIGTAAVAIGTAAAIPNNLVNVAAGGQARSSVVFGHPSGTLKVGADVACNNKQWNVEKVSMSRSARLLMEGSVSIPADYF